MQYTCRNFRRFTEIRRKPSVIAVILRTNQCVRPTCPTKQDRCKSLVDKPEPCGTCELFNSLLVFTDLSVTGADAAALTPTSPLRLPLDRMALLCISHPTGCKVTFFLSDDKSRFGGNLCDITLCRGSRREIWQGLRCAGRYFISL